MDLADAESDIGRQMVFLPPQEGKSVKCSGWFPLWLLAQDPTLRIMIVSYSQQRAERWGRWVRRMVEGHPDLGIELRTDSRAVDNWETLDGGGVVSLGIGAGATGLPADYILIDDPLRGRAEAESPTYRENTWDWWESNGATRLSARGKVLLILTRWHDADLAGRLLEREPGLWKVLRIPAVREPGKPPVRGHDGASVYSPQGELISVQDRRPGYYLELKGRRSLYVWNSIYMQTPVAAEGNLFRREDFRFWHPLEPDRSHHDPTGGRRVLLDHQGGRADRVYLGDCTRFLTVDLAASTKTSADWTVASVWAITLGGQLILLDRRRMRIDEDNHWRVIQPLTQLWAATTVYVERGFIGTTLIIQATKAGIHIEPVSPDKDKVTRAMPATHLVRAHEAFFPARAEWLDEWCDEIAGFPTAEFDDQTDTFGYAARIREAHWLAPEKDPDLPPPVRTGADRAYEAATGLRGVVSYEALDY